MPPAPPEVRTQPITALCRLVVSGAEATSRITIQPVFVDDAGRRRRMITGFGYLAALACIGYIVIVGISFTAGPTGPLAAMPDPKPNLVEALVKPQGVPPALSVESMAARASTAIAGPMPQPRLTRPASAVSAHGLPTVAPSAAPVTASVAPTTQAAPTSTACGHRRGCASTNAAPTLSVAATTAPLAAAASDR